MSDTPLCNIYFNAYFLFFAAKSVRMRETITEARRTRMGKALINLSFF